MSAQILAFDKDTTVASQGLIRALERCHALRREEARAGWIADAPDGVLPAGRKADVLAFFALLNAFGALLDTTTTEAYDAAAATIRSAALAGLQAGVPPYRALVKVSR